MELERRQCSFGARGLRDMTWCLPEKLELQEGAIRTCLTLHRVHIAMWDDLDLQGTDPAL